MISQDLSSQLKERFNPEGSDLRRQQLRMLEMLKQFDKFCRHHEITYWLSSGTLLGAVRHNGFIPWDDDLDIEMLAADFNKLLEFRDSLTQATGLVIQDHSSDPEYIAPYAKLRDSDSVINEIHLNDIHYKYRGIYIDIFVREKCSSVSTFLSHGLQYFSYKFTRVDNPKIRKYLKKILWCLLHSVIFPVFKYGDKLLYYSGKYRHLKGSGFYDYITLDMVFPIRKHIFEGEFFPIPNDADKYLRVQYGDYTKLPDLNNIHPHYSSIIFKSNEKEDN